MTEVIGPFEQAVLLALIRLGKDAYGRAILNEIQERLNRDVSAGAVYATLEPLESKGWRRRGLRLGPRLEAAARRYFAPTAAGIQALNDAKSATNRLWKGISWPPRVPA